ncbi:ABC transporter substrate-binding protein [Bradyrhizobium sp. CCGUVB1N3]|uniref:ABC transporter substrate-binding protein n=1 Tax=Bradyrhizobium sp. CCGUVB1N3 TaxID=2949629 RepID=UPI0020B26E1D|nr:ABC transporter substrate-binding protein [Bradyrhizobium sp. CCGUVB1N3]MCP3473317.1 ABC transporter substrate-binding protein [Bradyrhizobium sp. CCGUVB1N3]
MPAPVIKAAKPISRRAILQIGAAISAAAVVSPHAARGQGIPHIRYATGGGLGANEINTVLFTDWMKENVLKRHGKEYILDVTYTRGTPEAASLLAAGQADLATLSLPAFATTVARGAVPNGIKAIADNFQDAREGYATQGFYTLEDSPIHGVADLKGKTIAVNAFGTATDLLLRVVLKKNNIDPRKDVKIVEISFPSIGAAIREKRVDAGVLPLPFIANERAKGGIRQVFQGRDAFPPYAVIFQAATNDYLKAQPGAVRAWLADYVDALKWLYDPANRKKAIEVTAALSKSPPEVIDSFFLTEKDYYRDPNACLSPALFQGPLDAMAREGLIATSIDAAKVIDRSYLPFPCSG